MSFIVFILVVIGATNVVFLRNLEFYMFNVWLYILGTES